MKSDDYLNKVCTISEHIINYSEKIADSDDSKIRQLYKDEIAMELHKLRTIQITVYGNMVLDERKHKVVCAWCKVVISEGIEPISHGICNRCKDKATEGL